MLNGMLSSSTKNGPTTESRECHLEPLHCETKQKFFSVRE